MDELDAFLLIRALEALEIHMKNAMFSAPARTDILAGVAVLVLRFLIESVAGDNLIFLLLSFPMWLIAWTAITIGMAKLGKREDWRSGLHERCQDECAAIRGGFGFSQDLHHRRALPCICCWS